MRFKKIVATLLLALMPSLSFGYTINGSANIWGGNLNVYSDAGSTLKFKVNGSTGSFGMPSGQKFYLDGTGLAGDTYLQESSSNRMSFFTGGVEKLRIDPAVNADVSILNGNFSVPSGRGVYLDGGGDTYLYESTGNQVDAMAGGTLSLRWNTTDVVVGSGRDLRMQSTQKFYLDGGTDDYWTNSSNGVNVLVSGGTTTITTNSSGDVQIGGDLGISSGHRFDLDGVSGNDYWTNSSNGQNDLYSAGTLTIRTKSTGEVLIPAVDPPTANYANQNSFVKAWGYLDLAAGVNAGYNISTATRPFTGVYAINFSRAFSSANYAIVATAITTGDCIVASGISASQAAIHITDCTAGTPVNDAFSFIAIGSQ